ncbi:MAG: class I SAM-dependent methyltransferase [Acidobacteria bacterium]|nr:class I SAM-dependent methyltransferase [Acidobacteriota bacterium]
MDEAAARIRDLLAAGLPVSDKAFDACLPESQQRASARYWTPVRVAVRLAGWLAQAGVEQVLDVGSGAGKFCVVGALASDLTFSGVEHRAHLVGAAEELAERFGVSGRATFQAGTLDAVDFNRFGALYFYNPFGENHFTATDHLDGTVELNRRRFDREVARVEHLLERVPLGMHLATYNAYGGRVPDTFDLVQAQTAEVSLLRLWRKVRRRTSGGYWLEVEDTTVLRQPGGGEITHLPDPDGPAEAPPREGDQPEARC